MNGTESRIVTLEREVMRLQTEVFALESQIEERREHKKAKPKRTIRPMAPGERETRRAFIIAQRTPCVDCGEDDLRIMEFHHRDPSQKLGSVSTMENQRWSEEQILAEIAKCDCLCRNCHRKRHL